MRDRQRGQVLPLFALMLVALFAVAGLAIDVSAGYSARQAYRTASDAASLAGAQNLQTAGTRAVTPTDRVNARTDALASVLQAFDATTTGAGQCDPLAQIADCELAGTPFLVSIKTPSPTCVLCDSDHSVQVTVRNPTFQLSFSRVLGIGSWNVATTSVAGLAFARSYAIMTLRPPKASGSTFNVNDIVLSGNNTTVNVNQGDVGSNANMDYSGTGTVVNLDSGYGMYYFDPYFAPQWYTSPPIPPTQIVQQLPVLIADPNYRYPAMTGATTAPTFDDARTSQWATIPAVERADVDSACAAEVALVNPVNYPFIDPLVTTPDRIYCFNPGIYLSGTGAKNATISLGTGEIGLLKPGAYYLKSGMQIRGRILGGYDPGQPGVALMFDESGPGNCSSCVFDGNNAETIALNAGTKFPPGSRFVGAAGATAAIDWDNQLVETSGPGSPNPPILMTILVKKDTGGAGGTQACVVPTSAPFLEPTACDDGKNQTISIAGGGQLDVEGVQYAPTDNVTLGGSSDGNGTVGQIIGWTITYTGGTVINQEGPGTQGPGILRLDASCTAPGTPCNP